MVEKWPQTRGFAFSFLEGNVEALAVGLSLFTFVEKRSTQSTN